MNEVDTLKKALTAKALIDTLLSGQSYADLVLCGGKLINTLTKEIYEADVAIQKAHILMTGDASALIGPNTKVIDVSGRYISPGFIDSHMHFESSMLTVTEFTRLSLPSGTTTLIADPHEIGNALGPGGMKAMVDEALSMPTFVRLVVPALTPDCPKLETSGADIGAKDMEGLLNYPGVIGIGELQGFSIARHVYENTPEIVDDILASTNYAASRGLVVDGNAPELYGAELAAHVIATGGWTSCHETTSKRECVEKLRNGMHIFVREGSTAKNMAECIRALTEDGMDSRRFILATDDMMPADLQALGHMNEIVRRTIREGVNPVEAIQMVTINPANYFGLKDRGALAPGMVADLAILSDLAEMTVEAVFLGGELVAKDLQLLINLPAYRYPSCVKQSVRRAPVTEEELSIRSGKPEVTARCIVAEPNQNLTELALVKLPTKNEVVQADVANDALYMACVERYGRTRSIGLCFLRGFGLQQGAIAESVAHDTHNIIACGTNLRDLALAVNRVIEMGGGLSAANKGQVLGELRLPVGGLMTDELSGAEVSEKTRQLDNIAMEQLGSQMHAPYFHLSFLALSTSPKWKLSVKGLVDVEGFQIVPSLV